jgi:hypothetical protein
MEQNAKLLEEIIGLMDSDMGISVAMFRHSYPSGESILQA